MNKFFGRLGNSTFILLTGFILGIAFHHKNGVSLSADLVGDEDNSISRSIFAKRDNRASRDPAAIKKGFDFSHLEGSALDSATKKRLIEGLKTKNDHEDIGIELGHFVLKGSGDEKVFACQRYSKIILTFEGDGTAVGGELPRMEIEGSCEISKDINSISPIWIPASQILTQKPHDGLFSNPNLYSNQIRFFNISESWPKTWVLRSVRMRDQVGENSELAIETTELNQMLERPFLIKF